MPPAHRNLHGAQAVMTRQVEQFRVESEALNPLLVEEDAAALPAKSFETALRIHERQPQDDSNDLVENDSGKLAKRRLMYADQAAIHGARPNGDVIGSQSVDELAGFLDGRGKIRIREKYEAATRFLNAVADAIALAAVYAIRDDPQRGNLAAEGFRYGGRAILRTIVDHQNFGFAPASLKVAGNPLQCCWKSQFLVVGRDDNGKVGRGRAHREGGSCQP